MSKEELRIPAGFYLVVGAVGLLGVGTVGAVLYPCAESLRKGDAAELPRGVAPVR